VLGRFKEMERWGILAHGTWSDLENSKWVAFEDLNFYLLSLKREQKKGIFIDLNHC
jgi:hypothetical protein